MIRTVLAASVLALFVAGCGDKPAPPPPAAKQEAAPPPPAPAPTPPAPVVDAKPADGVVPASAPTPDAKPADGAAPAGAPAESKPAEPMADKKDDMKK